ncbi:hypothetical protein RSAG8_05527, partial [Rhizoctonia solani AG-8 WAC10335]
MKYTFTAAALAASFSLATALSVEPRQSSSFVKTSGKMKYTFTAAALAASFSLATALSVGPRQSSSFVKTSGQRFTLDGQKFTVVGSNAYWMPQLSNNADITKAFNDLKNAGFTALRTWGFNDVTSPSGTYYQIWNGKTATLNTGANGLGRFDTVVAQAKAAGIRLIVPLTNNWQDYGGMDVYVKQLLGSDKHDLFHTDRLYLQTITQWASAYSIVVSTHLSEAALEISSIDFGTFHSYPESWGQGSNAAGWGTQWIKDHAASQKAVNKPVILEEFGVTSSYNPSNTYTTWWDTIISSGLTGNLHLIHLREALFQAGRLTTMVFLCTPVRLSTHFKPSTQLLSRLAPDCII